MQKKSTYSFLKNAAAATAIASIAVGSAAFAAPAFAEVTGYDTGYSYHSGLANGDGAYLMSGQGQSEQASTAVVPSTDTTGTAVGTQPTTETQVMEVPAASSQAVAPSVAPAVQPAAAETAAPSFMATLASLSPATWGAIALVALAVIIGIAMLLAEAEPKRTTVTTTRSYQRYG
jgi:hypothetical protein